MATPTIRTVSTALSATAASLSSLTSAAGRPTTYGNGHLPRHRRAIRHGALPRRVPWSPMDITTGCCGWDATDRSTRSRRSETSPTVSATKGRVFITQLGPIPHELEDGKVLALRRGSDPDRGRQRGEHADRRRAGAARQAVRTVTGSMERSGRGLAGLPEHRPIVDRQTRRKPEAGR